MSGDWGDPHGSLRNRAEAILAKLPQEHADLSPGEIRRLIHDLSVHQIELELQNEELRNTQDQLEHAKNRYARLYHQAPVGYLSLDVSGIIRQSNQTFADMMSRESSELVGRALADFMTDSDHDIFLGRFKSFFKNPEGKIIDVMLCQRGMRGFMARLTGRREAGVFLPGGRETSEPPLLVIVNDISAQKAVEEALRQEQDISRQYLDVVGASVVAIRADQTVSLINQAGCRLLGYAHEEIIGANWFERFLPERARKEVEAIFVRLMAGVITPVEYTENVVLTRSGEERTVAWHNAVLRDGIGNITGTLSSGEDITERKRAQEELQRLSLVAAHTTNAVFITDAERRIEWVNQAFIQLTGFAPTEMRGKSSDEVLQGAETDPATVAAIRTALDAGQSYEGEILSYHRDGSTYWVQLLIDPVRDTEGRVTRFIGVQTDITARRQARLELQEKNAELERFIYLISHDLKSPLVTIKAFLGYLEQDLARSDVGRIAQDMDYMRAAADRMGQLLEELLGLSRVGRVARPPVRVGFRELAEEALRLTAGGITERGVTVHLDETIVMLVGDRARLMEIWQNLIENGVKYMGEQTVPRIEIGAERRGWELVFFVRDNGMGIEPCYQEKVFGLFEKLDPKSEGTGLGLALVKRIVELYRGHIWLESAGLGRGTCVWFTLPEAIEPRSEIQA
jgi:PAS domain S-box-containing protein